MALEDDYISQLTLGSKSALQSAGPTPSLPIDLPAGFGGQGVLSQPQATQVSPPSYYRSSPNSIVGQEQMSTFDKIMGAMMNAGTQPGELPVTTRLNMANAEIRLKQSQDQLAWQQFHKSQAVFENLLTQQRKDNITTAYGLMPNALAQIRAASTPEARKALVEGYANSMKAIAPGTEVIIEEYGKNPFHVSMWQAAASDFKNPAAKQLRDMIDVHGIEHVIQMPEGKALMSIMGHDGATQVISTFAQKDAERLHTGTMEEEEFRELYKQRMYDVNGLAWSPQLATAMEAYLDTPEGEQFMVGKKVKTNQMQQKQHAKDKPDDVIGADKNARYLKNKEILAFAEANPGVIDPARLKAAREQNAIALGDMQKQTNPGENVNNSVIQRWHIKTNHKYNSMDDALSLPDGPERTQALRAFDDARKEQDAASAFAQMGARMATPGDTSNYISADELLKTGRAVGVKGNIPEGELRSNKKYLKATPEQKKQLSELNVSQESSRQIFEEAGKAFTGSSAAEAAADAVLRAEDGLMNSPVKAIAKANYPALAIYVARRESTLGKFARSISGEVGVLTDQDVVRVRNLFPVGGDTKQIRASKKKSLDALINLNRKFAVEVLSGELLPEDVTALKGSDGYRSAVNGIFGSVEGLSTSQNIVPQATIPSDSKPKDTRTRAERLADEMRKEGR